MTAEKPTSVTESELATAIRLTVFPNDPSNPDGAHSTLSSLALHTADEIADALFTVIAARKAEAARWIAGDLYIDTCVAPGLNPEIYRREQDGWWCYSAGYHLRDGAIDTYGFRRLVPDPGTKPGPVPFARPHAFVPPYPAEDGPLKQPGASSLNEAFARLGRRLDAEDGRAPVPAHDHTKGSYDDCPGCIAEKAARASWMGIPATEGEH